MEVDKDVLTVALARAITDSVPQEMQKEIFRKALSDHLFFEPRNGESAVKQAFQRALNDATQDLARKVMEEPENQERIRAEFRKMLDAMLKDGSLVQKWTEKILSSIRYM